MCLLLLRSHSGIFFLGCLLMVFVWSIDRVQAVSEINVKQFDALKTRLIDDGFDKNTIQKIYRRPAVRFETQGVSLFLVHRESVLNYDQFTSRKAIQKARKYMEKYAPELGNAEKIYGVDQKIITAIILVETQLGTVMGRRSVLNTLSTIASLADREVREMFWTLVVSSNKRYAGLTKADFERRAIRKAKWAYSELKAFLEYTIQEGMDPVKIKGSYAGALGISQFMPSSILHYAQDGNNDGQIDLFSHADAIASVASYLKRNGWHKEITTTKASKVIYRYNRSQYYVNTILKISELLKG
ncbi:lytic murein transglycosylase [Thermodesulfobacteriota bacterium]